MKKKRINPSKESETWVNLLGIILIALAAVALLAIIFYLIYPYIKNVDLSVLPGATVNALMLSCVTLSITLSIVVPWMMSKSQIHSIAEDTVKQYYDKDFKLAIQKTHSILFRAYANDSRMIAHFLCGENKPVWALGWVCKSSTTYARVQDDNQRGTYKKLAISNVLVLIDCILKIYQKLSTLSLVEVLNDDNQEKTNEVATRTTRDLVKFCSTIELRDKDYADVFEDKKGQDIPETLNGAMVNLLHLMVKYLYTYYNDNGDSLYDRLELENEEDEGADIHIKYYDTIKKCCQNQDLDLLTTKFKESSVCLSVLFEKYLESRYTIN